MTDTLATRMIEAADTAHTEKLSETVKCKVCGGKGHEYIAGEPDWCSECGGAGYIPASQEDDAMRAALIASAQKIMLATDSELHKMFPSSAVSASSVRYMADALIHELQAEKDTAP